MATKSANYYDETAVAYDTLHDIEPEHTQGMRIGWPLLGSVSSVLDVGCGTGRSLRWLNEHYPRMELHGIDPSRRMIDIASRILPRCNFEQGYGESLSAGSGSVDVSIATGIMHHVENPSKVISEMFRVARKGILISDHNNYAFGGSLMRRARMGLRILGLLNAATFIRQGFNRQGYTDEDGWWYPYSLFDNYAEIARQSETVFIFPTRQPTGNLGNLVFSQSHFGLVAIKGQ